MKTQVLMHDKEKAVINWSDTTGCGQIVFTYKSGGKYLIDGEYIGMEKLIEIIKHIEL